MAKSKLKRSIASRPARRSLATGSDFVRELRYLVVKLKDADKYLTPTERDTLERLAAKCSLGRINDGKRILECVCVESDWPEYGPTWAAIEQRVSRTTVRDFDHEKAHALAGYPDNR